jgi:hypothetical protein
VSVTFDPRRSFVCSAGGCFYQLPWTADGAGGPDGGHAALGTEREDNDARQERAHEPDLSTGGCCV